MTVSIPVNREAIVSKISKAILSKFSSAIGAWSTVEVSEFTHWFIITLNLTQLAIKEGGKRIKQPNILRTFYASPDGTQVTEKL